MDEDSYIFHYETSETFNGYPRLTEDFAKELLYYFAGGHTPEIRDCLLRLEKAAREADEKTMYNFDKIY